MDTGVTLLHELVIAPLESAFHVFWSFAPSILSAIIILAIGTTIAKVLEQVIVRVLKVVTLDKIADQVQLSAVLSKGGIRRKLSELIGAMAYWIVLLAFAMAALDALNLTVAAELLQSVVSFLPSVIAAVFILVIGIFAAAFLAATVRTAASNAGILQAHLLGQLVQLTVVIFAAVAALQQLKIEFVGEVFLIILAGFSFGAALAFGLGCQELARRWVTSLLDQVKAQKR